MSPCRSICGTASESFRADRVLDSILYSLVLPLSSEKIHFVFLHAMHSQSFVRLSLLFIPLAHAVSRVYLPHLIHNLAILPSSALHRLSSTRMQNIEHISLLWFQLDLIKDAH